jgi:ferredoxin
MNLETHLNRFFERDWLLAIEALLPSIHEVDRIAVRIWFRFFPLELFRFLESAEDKDTAIFSLAIQGKYCLKDQIDSSHDFLYGHRYWRVVKSAIESKSESFNDDVVDLAGLIKRVADEVAKSARTDGSLTIAISAVGLMTLVQVGLDDFKAASGEIVKPKGIMAKSPGQIVAERAKDDSQGLFGFLKTVDKKFSVTYSENDPKGRFAIMSDQEIASASAKDRSQNWKAKDERCWEGVVPVECLSASCGTCWVGVIAGQEKLSEVAPRERRQMKVFGYNQPDDAKPILRLACQARASGNATIVVPPWNGVFGKKVYGNVEEVELEPVTSSAKALREVVREAASAGSDEN